MSKALLSCVLGALAVTAAVAVAIHGLFAVFVGSPDNDAQAQAVTIAPGTSVTGITTQLSELGLLDHPFWFKVYGKVSGKATGLQAGQFTIAPGNSVKRLYAALGSASSDEVTVTILEGWSLQQLDDALVAQGIGAPGEVVALGVDAEFRANWPFLAELPAGLDIEGYVFPETYRVFADATARDVLTKALDTFETRIVEGYAEEMAASDRSLFEIVTIASILEREVQTEQDMRMVADLIERRLALGMPLQMDSTVNYFTGKNDPGVTFTDRDTPSPYNTYLNPGLPIGPISNPSEQAIAAVLNPTPNNYLYFLTDLEGTVYYATTNDEHVVNKNRYLR